MKMNILLIYPKYPDTFWSYKHALKFIDKKAANPPLGLITIASLLPKEWNKKLLDINVNKLTTKHIEWADMVFISAMNIQKKSTLEIIRLCKYHNKKIVAGGPLFTEEYDSFPEVDHLILNEAEITLNEFLADLDNGSLKKIYTTDQFPSLKDSPIPDYSLLSLKKYASMNIQYSRGCPFNCEFCNITSLFGRKVRTKTTRQVLAELQKLYELNWKDNIFFVDDNFIGNKKVLKNDLLPAIIKWMEERNHPFTFNTEVSVNIADDDELLELLAQAGFNSVFVGIESPDEECLSECNKVQNINRDLHGSVRKIQQKGLQVTAGFIVGFDHDNQSVFQRQIDFINKSGIVSSMVGLLNAPRKSNLYHRLKKEGRITSDMSGDNTDFSINFIPEMNKEMLMNGYRRILDEIYSCKQYYNRVHTMLRQIKTNKKSKSRLTFQHIEAFVKSVFLIGIFNPGQKYYWKLLLWSLLRRPGVFPLAITYSIFGYHYRKVLNIRK